MFTGFDDDGDPLYDTKEAAIQRAEQMLAWEGKQDKIFVMRDWAPLWFAHLIQGTFLERLAYYEHKPC